MANLIVSKRFIANKKVFDYSYDNKDKLKYIFVFEILIKIYF